MRVICEECEWKDRQTEHFGLLVKDDILIIECNLCGSTIARLPMRGLYKPEHINMSCRVVLR